MANALKGKEMANFEFPLITKQGTRVEVQKQHNEMCSGSAAQREMYKAEIQLATGILSLIEVVLDDTPAGKKKLDDFKQSLQVEIDPAPDGVSFGIGGCGGGAHTIKRSLAIGSLPKCPHISDVKHYPELVQTRITKMDDAKELKKELTDKLGPWRDILKVGKFRDGQIKERRNTLSSTSSNRVTKTSCLPKVLLSNCLNSIFP